MKILSWGFRHTDTFQISKKNETIFSVKSWLAKKNEIEGITKEDIFLTLKKKEARNLKVFVKYNGPIKAPIVKDQEIAKQAGINGTPTVQLFKEKLLKILMEKKTMLLKILRQKI